ncbi:MAG: ATP-binding cassette domain-containing protein, partial [Trebonia sp.]|uniref:ATP-binding cassette domain-containing protein n=1 Tax=Trebonia sp. TaxID=2767075 RepID=UPI003BB090E4
MASDDGAGGDGAVDNGAVDNKAVDKSAGDNRAGGDAVLELDGLSVGYDRALVVRGLSLTVGHGEVVALLGANGAGKTTTLRAISGLLKHPPGTIRFGGT